MKTKTGICKVGNLHGVDVCIPCDATENTDASFDTQLIARLGETMYFVEPSWDFDLENFNKPVPILVNKESIKEIYITAISHATSCRLVLTGIDTSSHKKNLGIQELFFETYEEALEAVNSINKYYIDNSPSSNWEDDWKACVTIKYRYMLKFPVKPQDILLEDDNHYVANRVVAWIERGNTSVMYQGHDDTSYCDDKEVHSMHEYSGIQNQYSIVKLVESNEVVIDVDE